jgi:hypothetical protein
MAWLSLETTLHAWQIVIEARLEGDGRRLYDSDRAADSPLVTCEEYFSTTDLGGP